MPTSSGGSSRGCLYEFSPHAFKGTGHSHLPADANGLGDGVCEFVGPVVVDCLTVIFVRHTGVIPESVDCAADIAPAAVSPPSRSLLSLTHVAIRTPLPLSRLALSGFARPHGLGDSPLQCAQHFLLLLH